MKTGCDLAPGLAAIVLLALAVGNSAARQPNWDQKLARRTYRSEGGSTIPYRLFVPHPYDASKKYPLILFLHGAGERGDDNGLQLKNPEFLRFATDAVQAEHPCFVVAPQCPLGHRWVEVPWESGAPHKTPDEPSLPMRLTMELLDALEKEFSIDPDRRCVTGLSMGGFGAFDLIVRRPNDFAAAVVICGGADDSRAAQMAHIPFRIFHGSADPVVPATRSRSIVKALKAAGGDPSYTEYAGVGHNSWTRAYNEPELVEWLFGQRRKRVNIDSLRP
jgi:predicted peptidase